MGSELQTSQHKVELPDCISFCFLAVACESVTHRWMLVNVYSESRTSLWFLPLFWTGEVTHVHHHSRSHVYAYRWDISLPSRESVWCQQSCLQPSSACYLHRFPPLGFYFQPVSILTLSRCVFSKPHLAGFLLIQSVNMFSFICRLTCLHFYNYRYICKHTILLQEKYISPSVLCFPFSFLEFIIFEHIDTHAYTILWLSAIFQRL